MVAPCVVPDAKERMRRFWLAVLMRASTSNRFVGLSSTEASDK